MTTDINPGDQVVVVRPTTVHRGPLHVRSIDHGLIETTRRTRRGLVARRYFDRSDVVRLKPGQTVRDALLAAVPESQRCQICELNPAPERHFLTVPFPEAFARVCVEDLDNIKKEVRKRVKKIIAEVFAEAKAGHLKKLLKETP